MCWKSGYVGQTSDLRECAIRGAKTALPVVGVSLRRAPESDIARDRVVVDDVEGAAWQCVRRREDDGCTGETDHLAGCGSLWSYRHG